MWTATWALLNLGGLGAVYALLPLALAVGGLHYVSSGNRKRGYDNPGLLVSGLVGFGLLIAFLVIVGGLLRIRADAEADEEAEQTAEGQRNQDYLDSLAILDDRTFVVVGSVLWEKLYPDSRFGRASDIELLSNGDILVAGSRTKGYKSDGWVARFDRHGKPLWQRTYPAGIH